MKLFVLALVALSLPAQIRQPAANIRFGSSLPATCMASIGQVFFLTSASAGANLYGCTATNTWTVQGGSATIAGSISTGQICYGSASNTCAGSAGLTFSDAANIRLATLAGGSSQSTNPLLDVTNSAGSSHWLTVRGDGKVGVGTNAPGNKLQVAGAGIFTGTWVNDGQTSGISLSYGDLANSGRLQIFSPGVAYRPFDMFVASLNVATGTGSVTSALTVTNGGITGIGKSNTTPANATLSVLDATPASGATATWIGHDGSGTYSGVHLSALTTSLKVVAGLTQGSTNLQEWQNNAGVAQMSFGSGGLLFADNAYSIGASNASRPSSLYVVTRVNINNAASLRSTADGTLLLYNNGESDFNRLQFGGTTSSFPALKRSGVGLQVRLADDSAYSTLRVSSLLLNSGTIITDTGSGTVQLLNAAADGFTSVLFGLATSSFPSLKRSTAGIVARLADDSADTWVQASQFRSTLTTPASAAATCTTGTIVADTGFVYVCTATDTWKRVAIATW